MSSFVQSAYAFLNDKGTNIVIALFALVFGLLIIKNLMKCIEKAIIDSKLEKSMIKLVLTIIRFVLYFLLALYILKKLDINLTGFVAVFSAFSLAVGLAIQDIIGSFVNGLVIASTKPFKIGDTVEIGGITGTVKEINLMHTVIDTPDKAEVYLPNKTVYNSQIYNYSKLPFRRLDYEVVLDFSNDREEATECLKKVLETNSYVSKNPSPLVYISEIEEKGVRYKLRCWVENSNYWNLYNDIRGEVYSACTENKISFALPKVEMLEKRNKEEEK